MNKHFIMDDVVQSPDPEQRERAMRFLSDPAVRDALSRCCGQVRQVIQDETLPDGSYKRIEKCLVCGGGSYSLGTGFQPSNIAEESA